VSNHRTPTLEHFMAVDTDTPLVIVAPPRNVRYTRMAARAVTDVGAPPRTDKPEEQQTPRKR